MITEMPLPPPPAEEEQPLPPPPGPLIMRGATEGPLKDLIPVLFDFETYVTKEINLDRMRLRQYLDHSWVTALSLTIGFDQPVAFFQYPRPPYHGAPFDEFDPYPDLTATLRELAKDPKFVFVPYNAAFDIRVGRFKMNWTHPVNTWCALEGAMSAWPELPGGFGLGTVAETLNFPPELRKLTIDLRGGNYTQEEYKSYNIRDTEVLREVYIRQIARIRAREQMVGLSTQRQRRLHLLVNDERLNLLIKQLEQNAVLAELDAAKVLTDDERGHVFNHGEEERKKELKRAAKEGRTPAISDEDEALRSIRSKRLLGIVQEKFSAEINTTSMKKLSPVIAARNPGAASFLTNIGRANKMISHRRRSTVFRGAVEVDVELGAFRAHTGRFSSPSTGKGLNLHNVPKRDPAIAKPIRQTFLLPEDKVFVRGDLANVEYRVNGWMTQCDTIRKMFDPALGGNIFTDPYMAGWYSMTGVALKSKKDPVRQVSKSASLGLGFCLDGDTLIPTLNGIKHLKDVKQGDLVWNGRTWVKAGGAIKTGRKRCIKLGHTWLTEDHLVWWNGWRSAADVAATVDMSYHHAEPSSVDGLSPPQSSTSESNAVCVSGVSVARCHRSASISSTAVGVLNVGSVLTPGAVNAGVRPENTSSSCPTADSVDVGCAHTTTQSNGAETPPTPNTVTTVHGESKFASLLSSGSVISKPYEDGTTGLSFWIGGTTTDTTNAVICDSCRQPLRSETNGLVYEVRDVYDLLDVEDGHRFQAGEWLVHNCMSAARYVGELLKVIADTTTGVTEATLGELISSRKWDLPPPGQLKFIISRTGCSEVVATAAYHVHRLFNKAHPEFRMTANWLVDTVNAVASVGHDFDQARRMIDRWYLATAAPNRDRIDLSIDPDETRDTCSVRVRCGPWVETVCWREPKLRPTDFVANAAADFKLSVRKAYGPSKIFTPSLALENVVQAGARNMLCDGVLKLEKLGFMDYIHVHDELLLIVDKNPRAVLHARDNLLKVFGPGGSSPMEWAVLIKPDEVTVTESLYEDEADLYPIFGKDAAGEIDKKIIIRPGRWDMIEQNHPECLVGLP